MSTEHDDTRPIPGGAARAPAGDPAHPGAPGTEPPTTPIPRADPTTGTSGTAASTGPTAPPTRAFATGPGSGHPAISTSMRVGTVVWGLVLAIVGVGVIALAAGAQLDLQLAVIALLALAGAGLVVGSLVTAARQRRRDGRSPAS